MNGFVRRYDRFFIDRLQKERSVSLLILHSPTDQFSIQIAWETFIGSYCASLLRFVAIFFFTYDVSILLSDFPSSFLLALSICDMFRQPPFTLQIFFGGITLQILAVQMQNVSEEAKSHLLYKLMPSGIMKEERFVLVGVGVSTFLFHFVR